MSRLKAKAIHPLDVDKTEPTWENERASWFLIDNNHSGYSGWLVKNKSNDSREYMVLRNKDMEIMWASGVKEGGRLEAMYCELDILEAGTRLLRTGGKKYEGK